MNVFYLKCEKLGLKITPQRVAIYKELVRAKDHPTAEVMYGRVKKRLSNISFDTVYRTLLTFAEIDLVKVVEGSGEPKRFDPDLENHHHVRCVQCNTIVDFQEKSFDKITVPARIGKDFTIISKCVVLEGLCQKCRKK